VVDIEAIVVVDVEAVAGDDPTVAELSEGTKNEQTIASHLFQM